MDNDNAIDVLNSLITINNDRIEGYQRAMDETEESDLEALFSGFITTSENCKRELIDEVTKLGGEPAEGTRADGKLYRIWMDLKAAVTGKDRKAILSSCEYGEDVAVNTYEKALKNTSALTPGLQAIITSQHAKIKADHDKVRSMRDALVDA
jgi:uncharacterized protein (TIGR02284 family)